jgi:hypothetical protein
MATWSHFRAAGCLPIERVNDEIVNDEIVNDEIVNEKETLI